MTTTNIHIGTSGWHYPHWAGPFYPPGTLPGSFLNYYARHLDSVEINNTFYQLPAPAVVSGWRDQTPATFVFACKASRYITHMKKLKDPTRSTAAFFKAIAPLGNRLGPILFQLPPRWHLDVDRLTAFLAALPKRFRFAFEFRDPTWFDDEVYALLSSHNAALCTYDLGGYRSPARLTADFAYVRLHGPDGPYRGRYDGRALRGWARRFKGWRDHGIDIYCYFDNDEKGYAVEGARRLRDMVDSK